jgi:hypothetical protein
MIVMFKQDIYSRTKNLVLWARILNYGYIFLFGQTEQMRNNWRLVFSESMTRGDGLSKASRMGMLLRWGQASVFQCLHFRNIISADLVFFSTAHSQLSVQSNTISSFPIITSHLGENHVRDEY